ncbi:MAG: cytochrome c3 family protein, partial [Thermodesulfobacteriota bacterium]|nr:cytochrome c3 family protein [Thermodesulfobacteriota bacterium]
ERMNNYGLTYQAPYYYNSTTTYEPNGNSISNGTNMPDYVTFCTDCHNPSYDGQVSSSQKSNFTGGFQPLIYNPDWESTSPHGKIDAEKPDATKRKAPYNVTGTNYVLSCTDCHEPHGSPNGMLIRKEVNGASTVTFTSWASRDDWLTLCQRCHTIASNHQAGNPCYICHMHNKNWFRPL